MPVGKEKKTVTLTGTSVLDGESLNTAVDSFKKALIALENESVRANRTILWDTLEVSIERETMSDQSISGATVVEDYVTIDVRALAVRS